MTTDIASLDCEIITEFRELEAIAPEWQELWAASPGSQIFQHFSWARACWEAFGDELALLTPVVRRGSKLIGVLPLAVRRNTLQFLQAPFADYNDVICSDAHVDHVMGAAVKALRSHSEMWDFAVFDNLAAESRFARYVSGSAPSEKRYFRSAFRSPCPTIRLDADGTLASQLARKQSLRRHENHLRKKGELSFAHLENSSEIAQHLPSFFAQHIARRAVAGQESHFLDPRAQVLFRKLAEDLDPRSLLRFSMLQLDNEPLAYHFGFQTRDRLTWYQPSFDVNYWKSSPGEVLFRNLLMYAGERKLTEFDLTRGGELYKDRFATDVRANLVIYLRHGRSLRHAVQVSVSFANGGARRGLEWLRRYPAVHRFAHKFASKTLELYRNELRLRRTNGRRYSATLLNRLVRACFRARDSRIVFSMVCGDMVCEHPYAGDSGTSVERASLSELATLAATRPELCIPLRDLHARFLSDSIFYVVRQHGSPTQIWAATKGDSSPGENAGSTVLKQCWTAYRPQPVHAIREILRQICRPGSSVLLDCDARDPFARKLRAFGLAIAVQFCLEIFTA